MSNKRQINLALRTMTFPPMAIASILHRITGLVLFLLMPIMLYFLSVSLHDERSYRFFQDVMLKNPYYKLILWVFGVAFMYHLLAGIRHFFLDMGYGEALSCARKSAIAIIALSVVFTLLLGFWIW